jgi:hypothetical protein
MSYQGTCHEGGTRLITNLALNIYLQFLPNTTPDEVKDTFATIMVALDVAFTILVTLLLVGRIIVVRRRHFGLLGNWSSEILPNNF